MALDPKIVAQLKKDLQEINKIYKKIGEEPIDVDFNTAGLDDIKLIKHYLKEAREENELLFGSFRNIQQEVNDLFSGLNSISDEIKNQNQGYQLANKAVNSLTGTLGKVKDIRDNITTANLKDLKALQTKALQEKKYLEQSQRLLVNKASEESLSEKEAATLANVNGLLEDQRWFIPKH
jgi:septation ring formation regulator EzrA